MGKIVKFCSTCEEGFAEKFTFCPDCAGTLQAYEMNPLAQDAPPAEEIVAAPVADEAVNILEIPEEIVQEAAPTAEIEPVEEPIIEVAPVTEVLPVLEPVVETPAPKAAATSTSVFVQTNPVDVDRKPASLEAEHNAAAAKGGFYITVIEEKNNQRNKLLMATLSIMLVSLITGLVYNIFSKDLEIGAINDDIFNAVIVDNVEMEKEEVSKEKKDDGGGGGGGNNDPTPASQGERAPMRIDPQFAPSVSMDRVTDPAMQMQMAIKGPINENKINVDKYGVPLGGDDPSDGPGSNGGQGPGRNGGQGPGDGPGAGPGKNGGLNGGDRGGINPDNVGDPPARPAGVTQGLKIISKPKPPYTDAARVANIQGVVVLKVTFLASGQIGSITTIKGLPNGLTEQAIAAARRISFEPKKVDGVPQSVTKPVEYSFGIF